MKNKFLFLSLIAGLALPAIVHADSPATKTNSKTKRAAKDYKAKVAAVQPAAAKPHETDYITREAATGSHIPTVYRTYNGRVDNMSTAASGSNLAVYNQNALNRAGQLDVASELNFVDPSISFHTNGFGR
jgi:hypothetical protein